MTEEEFNEQQFIIGTMQWSFSRLNSWYNCKREWKKRYIDCVKGDPSAYGEFGTLCHETLENFFTGKLDAFSLAPYYEEQFDKKVVSPFPNNMYVDLREKAFNQGLEYFENFNLDLSEYEILGVEKEIHTTIADMDLIGFIDLLIRHKETGEIIICDHKSSTIKILKSGKISKSDQEHFESFKRQLYIYSKAVLEEYGRVDHLWWNMFKDQTWIKIDFDKAEYEAALQWAEDTYQDIIKEQEYGANPQNFYCNNLCSVRSHYCPYKRLNMIYEKIYSCCYSTRNQQYAEYGGAGIYMAEEWKESREAFFKWSLDHGYGADMLLKRIDETDWFTPENCYWGMSEEAERFYEEMV